MGVNRFARFAIVSVVLAIGAAYLALGMRTEYELPYTPEGVHRALFWDEKTFYDAILKSDPESISNGRVHGGVVPHHLLASSIIADFFRRVESSSIKRVVLIGPNHYELGRAGVMTSRYDWKTPVGVVRSDIGFINALSDRASYVGVNEDVAEQEHSISGIMPFIAHYVPSATVVPIILSARASAEELDDLAGTLQELSDEHTVFIASVDFSHYLSRRQAMERDATTLALLRDGNLDALGTLGNRYLDSPNSIILLIKIMRRLHQSQFQVLEHRNSGEILWNEFGEVTSYFSIIFAES